jgi:uncharacterized protein YgbK (DUF1537 family)
MKRTLTIMSILAVAVAFGVIPAGAQMMGNNQSHGKTMMTDSTTYMHNADLMKMMQKSTSQNTAMVADLNQIDEDFHQMMSIDDIKTLKVEMKKEVQRLTALHDEMQQMSQMQMQMNDMMNTGTMHGNMMGNRSHMSGMQNNMQTGQTGVAKDNVKSPGDKR